MVISTEGSDCTIIVRGTWARMKTNRNKVASILYQQNFSLVKNLFKHHLHLSKVGFRACRELQVPFPIHLLLLWCVAPVGLSVEAAETSVC